jgi:hypothetical protein
LPKLPDNLNELSWKALDNLNRQHQAEGTEDIKLQDRLQRMWKVHANFAADCKHKFDEIRARGSDRHNALRKSSDAMGVHERRDPSLRTLASLYDGTSVHRDRASMDASQIRASAANTAALPSNAFITKEDMEGGWHDVIEDGLSAEV